MSNVIISRLSPSTIVEIVSDLAEGEENHLVDMEAQSLVAQLVDLVGKDNAQAMLGTSYRIEAA